MSKRGTPISPEEYFADFKDSRVLHDIVAAIIALFGEVETRVTTSQIAFARERAFAWTWIPDRHLHGNHAPLVLSISLPHRNPSPRFKQIVEPSPGRFMHHLEIFAAGEIDDQVADWLREAYEYAENS